MGTEQRTVDACHGGPVDANPGEPDEIRRVGAAFHQGTRYQATAHAVPFLLDLLADPATPDRPELADLLALLAVGYDEQWLPGTFPVARYRARAVGGEELLRAAPPVVGEEDRYSWYDSLSDGDAAALYSSGMPAVTVLYEVLRRAWPDGEPNAHLRDRPLTGRFMASRPPTPSAAREG